MEKWRGFSRKEKLRRFAGLAIMPCMGAGVIIVFFGAGFNSPTMQLIGMGITMLGAAPVAIFLVVELAKDILTGN